MAEKTCASATRICQLAVDCRHVAGVLPLKTLAPRRVRETRCNDFCKLLGGLGLGFLLASAFSTFWWWWALGAILFGTVTLTAVITAARNSEIIRP